MEKLWNSSLMLPRVSPGFGESSSFYHLFADSLIDMNTQATNSMIAIFALTLWSGAVLAADEVPAAGELKLTLPTTYEFVDGEATGLYRKKLSSDFRIRGWRVADSMYLGQAKVGNKWGFGMVYEKGNTSYGINHRGVQMLKRF